MLRVNGDPFILDIVERNLEFLFQEVIRYNANKQLQ